MTARGPTSVVHALASLGLTRADAWRCVHLMQGRDCLVLLRYGAEDPAQTQDPPRMDMADIADAVARGAMWEACGPAQWQYLRRVDWSIGQLEELRQDLLRLAALHPAS